MVVGLSVAGLGCGPWHGTATVRTFPRDGDVVERNAAVYLDVYPTEANVSGFTLSEVYNGSLIDVFCDETHAYGSRGYVYCPRQTLSAWTKYYAEVRVADRTYGWYFETNGDYNGNPIECYFDQP
jgi:hypothetical protein